MGRFCLSCFIDFRHQLKSQKTRLGIDSLAPARSALAGLRPALRDKFLSPFPKRLKCITDGAYDAMMNAIRRDELPSMYFMHYEIAPPHPGPLPRGGEGVRRTVEGEWIVRNLLLVPHFAFPASAIIKRKPLSSSARRAGWVGCNFDLSRIPAEARIFLVRTTVPQRRSGVAPDSDLKHKEYGDRRDACPTIIIPPEEVQDKFKRVKPLKEIGVRERGWTLDVLNIVRRICEVGTPRRGVRGERTAGPAVPTNEFSTSDVYTFTRELEKLHPDNRHVRDKIRQQLQVGFLFARICVCRLTQMPDAKRLRDAGLLIHIGRGEWRLP